MESNNSPPLVPNNIVNSCIASSGQNFNTPITEYNVSGSPISVHGVHDIDTHEHRIEPNQVGSDTISPG